MTTFQKLKHEARRAEQRSDWARAIDLYQQALDADEDMADLSLYNRIGDLHLRLGENEAAVEYYERAVDRYADNAMHTSAIALCNKILRIAPGRTAVYRRLSMLHARTGLVAEGRSSMMAYVRHVAADGRPDDAAEAVKEFVELTADEEIGVQVAAELAGNGHPIAAAEQLRAVARARTRRGEAVGDLQERIEQLAPEGGGTPDAQESVAPTGPVTRRRGPERLARLVLGRLSERGLNAAFTVEVPASTPEAQPAPDELPEVRRQASRFVSRVADVLETGDPTIRYDLGVEFMTIGLLEEAIREFQIAIADPGLLEAANARIGECLALRVSGASFDVSRHAARALGVATDDPAVTEPDGAEVNAHVEAEVDARVEPDVEPDVEPQHRPGEGDDELDGHFFRARLAQYRIRQAEERHKVDHAAHLDLGSAYVGMGLHEEALREFGVALEGPRPVSGRAVKALEKLALGLEHAPEVALKIVDRLTEAGSETAARRLSEGLDASWGGDHPLAGDLAEQLGRLGGADDDLPALEDMFPALGEPATAGSVTLDEVPSAPAASGEPVDRILVQAAERVAAGEVEPAIAHLRDSFTRLQTERRTREALLVLERLLELQPDDVTLHYQRTELATMVNDRDLLLAAFAALGACQRRLGAPRRARAAYGRMLDVDPSNELARQAIARIDADELDLERDAPGDRGPVAGEEAGSPTPEPEDDAEEMAAMFQFLEDFDEDEIEIVADSTEADPARRDEPDGIDDPTARSRYELGQAFRQMGMWDEAIRELRPAVDSVADRLGALEALAECLLKAGRPKEAIELLQSNLRADEDTEVAPLYFLGLALQAEGKEAGARDAFTRVEAAHPGYRDTADRLSQLSL